MTSLKTTSIASIIVLILGSGCAAPEPPRPAPGQPLAAPDSDSDSGSGVIDRARITGVKRQIRHWEQAIRVALALYYDGGQAEESDDGLAAFRIVCRVKEAERAIALDALREHAQIHAYAWKLWYHDHCGSPILRGRQTSGNTMSSVILNPETGQRASEGEACDADTAGAAPGRTYVKTADESLAQAQRDACEDAQ